jgi:hypothetical protein
MPTTQGEGRRSPSPATSQGALATHLPDLYVFTISWGPPPQVPGVSVSSGLGGWFGNKKPSTPPPPKPWENLPEDKAYLRVQVVNRGDRKFDSANAKGPVEVWVRIWKPAKAQSVTATDPEATSFLWGGVMKLDGLEGNTSREVGFVVPRPPGGWEMQCAAWVGCSPTTGADQLRLRIVARVDPSNKIEESDETNNNFGWFLQLRPDIFY